jgi:hypothetical protein
MSLSQRRRWTRSLGVAVVSLAVVGSLTGCSSRAALGTTDGGCFTALPTASTAVHHRGHLVGARLLGVNTLGRHSPFRSVVSSAPGPAVRRVCLVAFLGMFKAGEVALPDGAPRGPIAVALVEYPQSRLLGTAILRYLPEGFGHGELGGG